MYGRLMVLGLILAAFALPSTAHAGSASPNPVEFGDVPVNTTVTRDVTITVDAGYRTELASGQRHQRALRLQLRHLRRRRWLHRPRHLQRQAALHADRRRDARAGSTNVFQCPVGGGTCIPITYAVNGRGISNANGEPEPGRVRRRAGEHDGDA